MFNQNKSGKNDVRRGSCETETWRLCTQSMRRKRRLAARSYFANDFSELDARQRCNYGIRPWMSAGCVYGGMVGILGGVWAYSIHCHLAVEVRQIYGLNSVTWDRQ